LILKELDARVEIQEDARVMVDSLMVQWELICALLGSPDARIRQYTCKVLRIVASHESPSLVLDACQRFAFLLRCLQHFFLHDTYCSWDQSDEDTEVRESALSAIVKISESPGGAQAISDIKMWEFFPELLDPSNAIMYRFTRSILGNLAVYQVTLLKVANSRFLHGF
jgi:hypothetical protein